MRQILEEKDKIRFLNMIPAVKVTRRYDCGIRDVKKNIFMR